MAFEEIEIPIELGSQLLEKAEETSLGKKNGAIKQYRYGNLHIREYENKLLIHTDKIDPRKNPLGHLIQDAPEVLVGLASAVIGGGKIASIIYNNQKNSNSPKQSSIFFGLVASIVLGYLGYTITKKFKSL